MSTLLPYAQRICGLLIGWITFLHLGFLLFIGTSVLLSQFSFDIKLGSPSFYIQIVIIGLITCAIGFFAGRRFYRWIVQKRPWVVYTWLLFLIIFTIISFPQTFTYTIIE